jgi:hypothetical protein
LLSLAQDPTNPLHTIGIKITLPLDAFNKNANCHIDKIIQELEIEIKKISPTGAKLTPIDLARATLILNNRIRKSGFTASENHFSRDSATLSKIQENPTLKQHQQQPQKPSKNQPNHSPPLVTTGDTVFIKSHGDKHTTRQPFLITEKIGNDLKVRKILHQHPRAPNRLRLSHFQQSTSMASVYPAVRSQTFHRRKQQPPKQSRPHETRHSRPISDSESDFEDPTPTEDYEPPFQGPNHPPQGEENNPPPANQPPQQPTPIEIQEHLLLEVQHSAKAIQPPHLIPHLQRLHNDHRLMAHNNKPSPSNDQRTTPPPNLPPPGCQTTGKCPSPPQHTPT